MRNNYGAAAQTAGVRLLSEDEIHAVSGGMDADETIILAAVIYGFAVGALVGIAQGIWRAIWG
jgi:hypothetical protein